MKKQQVELLRKEIKKIEKMVDKHGAECRRIALENVNGTRSEEYQVRVAIWEKYYTMAEELTAMADYLESK